MKKVLIGCLATLCLTGCPGDEEPPPTPQTDMKDDLVVDMTEDITPDLKQDMNDMDMSTTCLVSSPASTFELGKAHTWEVDVTCNTPLSCTAPSCITLKRAKVDTQQAIMGSSFEVIDSGSNRYRVRFETLQSPPASPNAEGAYDTVGEESVVLSIEGVQQPLDAQVHWSLSDEVVKTLNQQETSRVFLPEQLKSGRLMGLRVMGTSRASIQSEVRQLWGVVARANQVDVVKQVDENPAEVVTSITGDATTWIDPYFDIIERADGQTLYWRAFDTTTKQWTGVVIEVASDGTHQVAGTWQSPNTIERIDPQTVVSTGQTNTLWNVGYRASGEMVLIQTTRAVNGAPQTVAMDVREAEVIKTPAQGERIGLVGEHLETIMFWSAKAGANGVDVQLRRGIITTQDNGPSTVQLNAAQQTLTLDNIASVNDLRVERLAQPNGEVVGVVFHDGSSVTLVQPDEQGALTKVTRLTSPPQLRIGIEPLNRTHHSTSPSFVLEGNQLVALGRWPWNWRDKLKSSASPTFVTQWDLTSGLSDGTWIARNPTKLTDTIEYVSQRTTLETLDRQGAGADSFVDHLGCEAVGDCHLLDALPTGEQLYLKGGKEGPTLAGGKYGDILIDGVPLQFDLVRPSGAMPALASVPTLLRRPKGGAFVVLPVWEDGQANPVHKLWLMNDDGTLIKTKTTIDVETTSNAADVLSPTRTVNGQLALLIKTQVAPHLVTYQLVDSARFADADNDPTNESTVTPMLGTLSFRNAGRVVAESHGFGQSKPIFAQDGLTLVGAKVDVTNTVASVSKDNTAMWMLGHVGDNCGALTLVRFENLEGELKGDVAWTQAAQEGDCSDADAILGTGRFLSSTHTAVATYNPKSRALKLMYLVKQDQTIDVIHETLATLEEPQGQLSFAIADVNGDGLADVVVDGQWRDGVRVVKNLGQAKGAVLTLPSVNATFQVGPQLSKSAAPQPAPNLMGQPQMQFASMSSGGISSVNAGTFQKVVTGGTHSCALRTSGQAVCWGDDFVSLYTTPQDTFQDIVAGENFVCGHKLNGQVLCWGRNNEQQLNAPAHVFKSIDSGQILSCGIKSDDTVACWGNYGMTGQLGGTFTKVQVGNGSACGLRPSGLIECWDNFGNPITNNTPTGTFTTFDVSATDAGCGVQNGALSCWQNGILPAPPMGMFKQVTVGFGHACAIKSDDTVACWGNNIYQQINAPTDTFKQISTYRFHTCGITTDDRVSCWGNNIDNESTVPTRQWVQVLPGSAFTCGRRSDMTVTCWGAPSKPNIPASTRWVDMTVGMYHACGFTPSGQVECFPSAATPSMPATPWTKISAGWSAWNGNYLTCGLRPNQTIDCWGQLPSLFTMPSGSYSTLETGLAAGCGLKLNGEIECWGNHLGIRALSFSGSWSQMTIGANHVCALDASGSTTCWWSPYIPTHYNPPATLFKAISSGAHSACGMKMDNTIQCWGSNQYGIHNTPPGQFASMAYFLRHACAVRSNGDAVCWGANHSGQLNIPN